MQTTGNVLDSEQTLLWRTWQERRRRADRLIDRRMTVFVIAAGLILLACIVYSVLRAKASSNPDDLQHGLVHDCSSSLIA